MWELRHFEKKIISEGGFIFMTLAEGIFNVEVKNFSEHLTQVIKEPFVTAKVEKGLKIY